MKTTFVVLSLAVLASIAVFLWINRKELWSEFMMRHMESESRARRLQVDKVVRTLALPKGAKVADIGSGPGLFTLRFAEAVGPSGAVYAVDVDERMLQRLSDRVEERGLTQVQTILSEPDDPGLPERVDLVFLCNTLHHVLTPEQYIGTLAGSLTPAGRIAVIDFNSRFALFHRRQFSAEDLRSWMDHAGMAPFGNHDFIGGEFFEVYRRQTIDPARRPVAQILSPAEGVSH